MSHLKDAFGGASPETKAMRYHFNAAGEQVGAEPITGMKGTSLTITNGMDNNPGFDPNTLG